MQNEQPLDPGKSQPAIPELSGTQPKPPAPLERQLALCPETGLRYWVSTLGANISGIWKRRHPRLRRWFLVAFSAALVISTLGWLWTHWTDPDRDFKITNFLAAFYPVPLSVFTAFLPDMERSEKMRPVWRIGIVAAGLLYSLILWHQQTINLANSRQDQKEIVSAAVSKSNMHADQQIEGVRQNLKEVSTHSDEQISTVKSELKDTTQTLSELVSKTTSALGVSISKVGKPDPPAPAKLQFTLWGQGAPWPVLTSSLRPDKDGVFSVEYAASNLSSTSANNVDIWLDICTLCSFAKEPDGFDRPAGMPDQTRHMMISLLNPGASMPKKTAQIKMPLPTDSFVVGWIYSSELCGGGMAPEQLAKILVLPAVPEK